MKELTQFLRANNKLIPLLIGIFVLPFNRLVFISYPNFFQGKFNFFQTEKILISSLVILVGCIYFLATNYKNIKIQNFSFLLFFLYLFFITQNLIFIIGFVLVTTLNLLNKRQRNLVILALSFTVGIQIIISILQLLLQSSIGLQLIGEPTINENIKGIAKVRTNFETILRPYGTLPHPNILGALAGLTLLLSKEIKHKYLMSMGLLSSLSISANLSTFAAQFFSKKNKILLTILSLSLLCTLSLRLLDNNKESVTERIEQTESLAKQELPFKTILIGSSENIINHTKQKPWQYTPTHNTYLQTFQIAGLIGLTLLIFCIFSLVKTNPTITIFLSVTFLFDHFWITTPHGILMLALALGLAKKPTITS